MPQSIIDKIENLSLKDVTELEVDQIKSLRSHLDEELKKNEQELRKSEIERNSALREVGNHLHDSVPVSNDEVSICIFI